MKNIDSSLGYIEDLIRCAQQLCCTEGHLESLVENTLSAMENGIETKINVKDVSDMLLEVSDLRRKAMRVITQNFDTDTSVYCLVKHTLNAEYLAYEAYVGSDDDNDLLAIWQDTRKQFVKAFSMWTGMEITDCSACLNDFLKGV